MPDIQILKDELAAGHPVTGAYSADNQTAADQLNSINTTQNVASLSGDQVFNAADEAELAALATGTNAQKQSFEMFLMLCARDNIDPFGIANERLVREVFGAGSISLGALSALRTQPASRGQVIGWGVVGLGDIEEARS